MFLTCGTFKLDLSRPRVMGIINVTPDSFSDGGRFLLRDAALIHAEQLMADGADILDIGGESTRPGAAAVSVQEELDRVMPVIEALKDVGVPLSIDTLKTEVMRASIAAGIHMVNDVNALQAADALSVVAASHAGICLMHKQGEPATMQQRPQYDEVSDEVLAFLQARVQAAEAAGVARDRIAIDPGFGFGKTLQHNLQLLQNLQRFASLGFPVLAGLSRKSMLGMITGREVGQRLAASLAAAIMAVDNGARILRVHDVKETVDALKVWSAVDGC